MIRPPELNRILAAPRHIDPAFLATPLLRRTPLDAVLGCEAMLKMECFNPVRSFKGRGAELFAATELHPGETLVCASAGNFGQALAHSAVRRGHRCIVFAAETASPIKIAAMRRLGAELHLAGIDFEMAKRSARRHAAAAGLRFVEDGAEPAIAEGAGTIGVELAAGAELDSVVVPIGDGALLAGVGVALRHLAPTVRIVGVVAKGASAMQLSLAAGRPVATERADTIADGLACREPVAEAVAMLEGGYDEVRGVADADIVRAMAVAVDCLGIVLEPAGAAGIAAILADPAEFARQRTGIIVSGSNATLEQLSGWMASCSAARCQAGPP